MTHESYIGIARALGFRRYIQGKAITKHFHTGDEWQLS